MTMTERTAPPDDPEERMRVALVLMDEGWTPGEVKQELHRRWETTRALVSQTVRRAHAAWVALRDDVGEDVRSVRMVLNSRANARAAAIHRECMRELEALETLPVGKRGRGQTVQRATSLAKEALSHDRAIAEWAGVGSVPLSPMLTDEDARQTLIEATTDNLEALTTEQLVDLNAQVTAVTAERSDLATVHQRRVSSGDILAAAMVRLEGAATKH